MTQTILLILGIIIVAILLTQKGRASLRAGLRRGGASVKGICAAAVGLDAKKREQKEKILALFAEEKEKSLSGNPPSFGHPLYERGNRESSFVKGEKIDRELSNSDIREALGISERSAVRYMDELEREGKVEQVGNTGRGVAYRLKP